MKGVILDTAFFIAFRQKIGDQLPVLRPDFYSVPCTGEDMITVEVVVRAEDFDPYRGLKAIAHGIGNPSAIHRQSIGVDLLLLDRE